LNSRKTVAPGTIARIADHQRNRLMRQTAAREPQIVP
jgi:hypothetical protein